MHCNEDCVWDKDKDKDNQGVEVCHTKYFWEVSPRAPTVWVKNKLCLFTTWQRRPKNPNVYFSFRPHIPGREYLDLDPIGLQPYWASFWLAHKKITYKKQLLTQNWKSPVPVLCCSIFIPVRNVPNILCTNAPYFTKLLQNSPKWESPITDEKTSSSHRTNKHAALSLPYFSSSALQEIRINMHDPLLRRGPATNMMGRGSTSRLLPGGGGGGGGGQGQQGQQGNNANELMLHQVPPMLHCKKNLQKMGGVSPSDIDKYSRILFPVSFICFNLMYWIIYLNISEDVVPDLVHLGSNWGAVCNDNCDFRRKKAPSCFLHPSCVTTCSTTLKNLQQPTCIPAPFSQRKAFILESLGGVQFAIFIFLQSAAGSSGGGTVVCT